MDKIEKVNSIFLIFVLGVVFTIGVYAIDMGSNMLILESSGMHVTAKNIIVTNVDGNFLYHAGILLVMFIFCLTIVLLIYKKVDTFG